MVVRATEVVVGSCEDANQLRCLLGFRQRLDGFDYPPVLLVLMPDLALIDEPPLFAVPVDRRGHCPGVDRGTDLAYYVDDCPAEDRPIITEVGERCRPVVGRAGKVSGEASRASADGGSSVASAGLGAVRTHDLGGERIRRDHYPEMVWSVQVVGAVVIVAQPHAAVDAIAPREQSAASSAA